MVDQSVVNYGPLVSTERGDFLSAPFTKEEIRKAMFSVPKIKAPGLDGYNSSFYKMSWDIIGDDICYVV
uniref:Uncharacterized protein n=1 Tax=Chenopodium quinoa TaxID=63459 RepID=A0A803MYV0_CHEQI